MVQDKEGGTETAEKTEERHNNNIMIEEESRVWRRTGTKGME